MAQARKAKDKFGRNPSKFPRNSEQRNAVSRNKQGGHMTQEAAQDFLEKWAEGK